MSKERVTLADVARRAGVHATTVSLALRNHPRLPEKTRLRIQRIAKAMGYTPDPGARALVGYRKNINAPRVANTIAYVTNWNTRWGWKEVTAHPEFYRGAEARARELGYSLEHFWMRERGITHGRLSGILETRGIRGVIIASHVREIDEELRLDWSRFSAVKIDYFPHQPALAMVTNDQLQVIRLAMRRVIAAGFRRIGFVMDDGWDITVERLWSVGFNFEQIALSPENRIPPYLIPSEEPLTDWIRRNRPEVLISTADFVFPAIRELGFRVPRDLAFVDVFLSDTSGRIAGVRQNHLNVGATAVELLSGQLQHNMFGIPEIPSVTQIEGTWCEGKSLPRLARQRPG